MLLTNKETQLPFTFFDRAVSKQHNSDYLLFLDSDTHIDDPHLIQKLITLNRYTLLVKTASLLLISCNI